VIPRCPRCSSLMREDSQFLAEMEASHLPQRRFLCTSGHSHTTGIAAGLAYRSPDHDPPAGGKWSKEPFVSDQPCLACGEPLGTVRTTNQRRHTRCARRDEDVRQQQRRRVAARRARQKAEA
jgi:hypothetical protein